MAFGEALPIPAQGGPGLRTGRRLPRSFYARPSEDVATDLLGRLLVHRIAPGVVMSARIVETEAYGRDDPASHAFRGRTARNDVMFGPPSRLYVYVIYGMHRCMNVATDVQGVGSAVLLRAGRPTGGFDIMRTHRGAVAERLLCSGPGRFAKALGVTLDLNGADLVSGDQGIWICEGSAVTPGDIDTSPRVGTTRGLERQWRFFVRDEDAVSKYRPGRASRRGSAGPSTP